MRFLRQSLMGLFLLAVTAGLLVYAGNMMFESISERLSREARSPQQRERMFTVNVQLAELQTVTPVLTAFGEVQSRRSLDVRAAAAGTITSLAENFVEGGQVTEGELLVQIDTAKAQLALDRVKADRLDAEAEARDAARALELARDELVAAREQADLRMRAFKRASDLAERGVGSAALAETAELAASSARQAVLSRRQALANAEARVDQAATRLERTRIAAEEAERNLSDTTIMAEFSGTLSDVSVVEGGLVSPNERLARLIDPRALEVAVRVSTPQYARLLNDEGALMRAPATVTLEAFGVDLTSRGVISRDSAAVGDGQTGRLIFARLDESRGLKPGDFVTVRLDEPPLERVVKLPSSALGGSGEVLVLGEGDRLEALPVTLLRRQGDDILVRGKGLAGRDVVTRRTPLLGAGIRVKPLRGEAASVPQEPELVELSDERRAKLIAFVEANAMMPKDVKQRILTALDRPKVPARMVDRLESRMGG
jgi:multidrug efflux pump subunit AcrA (membrane-fusion protein)